MHSSQVPALPHGDSPLCLSGVRAMKDSIHSLRWILDAIAGCSYSIANGSGPGLYEIGLFQ
jgi:hypothetical protein